MTDLISWADSDPFEEDDSWMSEPESVCNNWRGWKKIPSNGSSNGLSLLGGGAGSSNSQSNPFNPFNTSSLSTGRIGSNSTNGSAVATVSSVVSTLSNTVTTTQSSVLVGPNNPLSSIVINVASSQASTTATTPTVVGLGANGTSSSTAAHPNGRRPSSPTYAILNSTFRDMTTVPSLTELTARVVANYIPFEVVEKIFPPVPEPLQLRIAFWSFPNNDEDIRLYSCLANGSADEFQKGESLYRSDAVRRLLQIGFHLSATVASSMLKPFTVAVTFDRGRITKCSCTCNCQSSWCSHVVCVCLHRIYQPTTISLRAPVSESLYRLDLHQLRKFALNLIAEFPQQILPTAQRLLDDLLLNQQSNINLMFGAPDPTAGASIHDQTKWCLDKGLLQENIRKIVIKLCIPSPMVYSDVNFLVTTAPPAASEWTSLLRPLRGREPEGLWNLLSIVREMLRRHDRNSFPLLTILTEEILSCDQILVWWFNTNVSLLKGYPATSNGSVVSNGNNNGNNGSGNNGSNNQNNRSSIHSNIHTSQHACSSLCDEIVVLWRLLVLNPALSVQDTQSLFKRLRCYHMETLAIVMDKLGTNHSSVNVNATNSNVNGNGKTQSDIEIFSGFKPAMASCLIDWSAYPIHGITDQSNRPYCCTSINQASPSLSTIGCQHAISGSVKMDHHYHHHHHQTWKNQTEDNQSSLMKQSSSDSSTVSTEANTGDDEADDTNEGNDSEDSGMNNGNEQEWDQSTQSSRSNGLEENSQPTIDEVVEPSIAPESGCRKGTNSDYQIYFYEDQDPIGRHSKRSTSAYVGWSQLVESGNFHERFSIEMIEAIEVKPIEDSFEILFSRAEALYAHGYVKEASQLSVRLAQELLNDPPVLQVEAEPGTSNSTGNNILPLPTPSTSQQCQQSTSGRNHTKRTVRCRFNPHLHRISLLASATLSKAAFLCQVLSENDQSHLLAFHVGLFGLELVRPPASTKALEVKLANQEQELVNSLKRIPLCSRALAVLREKAEQLRNGRMTTRGDALLPLTLASYIFDALVLSNCATPISTSSYGITMLQTPLNVNTWRHPDDEKLGFEASVAAIGLKANVAEAEHPLLCEGTRRQRGDLALTLLVHYKDNKERLNKIMDKLLDKDIHQIYRKTANSTNLLTMETINQQQKGTSPARVVRTQQQQQQPPPPSTSTETTTSAEQISGEQSSTSKEGFLGSSPGPSGVCRWDEEYKSWEAKFRRMNLSNNIEEGQQASTSNQSSQPIASSPLTTATVGMNMNSSIDSASAPETTSSDNSPTMTRRRTNLSFQTPQQSSTPTIGKSDIMIMAHRTLPHPPPRPMYINHNSKRGLYPIIPNQPSEASAHFMFELAKTVLAKAGGNNTSVLFTQPPSAQNCRAPHRNLHMCAFKIGLYALGLHNAVTPNWLSRTYSSQASWITCQAMEIGPQAISFLIDTWEGHLTPPEVADLADRAHRGPGQEKMMVQSAAMLALSCLPHAHALTPINIQIALNQCKEQSNTMLERACLVVEQAAQGGGVHPEVLFKIAKIWHELYKAEVKETERQTNENQNDQETQSPIEYRSNQDDQRKPITMDQYAAAAAYYQADPTIAGYFMVPQSFPQDVGQFGGIPTSVTAAQVQGSDISMNSSGPIVSYSASQQSNGMVFPGAVYGGQTAAIGPEGPIQFFNPNAGFMGQPQQQPAIITQSQQQQQQQQRTFCNQYPYGPISTPNPQLFPYQYKPGVAASNYYLLRPMIQPNGVSNQSTSSQVPTLNMSNNNGVQQQQSSPSLMFYYMGYPKTIATSGGPYVTAPSQHHGQTNHGHGGHHHNYGQHQHGQQASASNGHHHHNHSHHHHHPHGHKSMSQRQMAYMHSAYRVGMLAMDALARRCHDERPLLKFARNPTYCEDVKWLRDISKEFGPPFLQEFCMFSVNAIASPFVLYDIIIDVAPSLAANSSTLNNVSTISSPYIQSIRSQLLAPLIQKCQQLFTQCIWQKINHINASDYEDFLTIIRSARAAFNLVPGGHLHFNEVIHGLKRQKTCKKELWIMIQNVLANG
ncbi:hypothetical protein RDWZM_007436 [Blomia tropicalis]|uniref:SWIM-type domain-containing protein n=1 Tax=Blomia tropicalis TaxID=40697 RepID=A0A9Q0RJ11_BLOTA|nr:hypothetical protein RDWZM_007436 [Blomia tropicalis]